MTIPPAPALFIPPTYTRVAINSAPIASDNATGVLNRLVIIADEESSWEVMLMNMPIRNNIDPTVSARRPYCCLTTSISVLHPLLRKGPA